MVWRGEEGRVSALRRVSGATFGTHTLEQEMVMCALNVPDTAIAYAAGGIARVQLGCFNSPQSI